MLQRKQFILHFASNDENDSACTQQEQIEPKVRNSSSSMFAFSLHFGWQLKNDSNSTRYPFCLRFWFKVEKIICLLPNQFDSQTRDSSFRTEGTHFTFSFRSKLQRPTHGSSKWQLQKGLTETCKKLADLSLKWIT